MTTVISDFTLGPGINDIAVSGFSVIQSYPVNAATIIAHPSNTGVLYVRKRTATSGLGFPLAAGERVSLTGVDLHDYTASGVSGQRLAFVADK